MKTLLWCAACVWFSMSFGAGSVYANGLTDRQVKCIVKQDGKFMKAAFAHSHKSATGSALGMIQCFDRKARRNRTLKTGASFVASCAEHIVEEISPEVVWDGSEGYGFAQEWLGAVIREDCLFPYVFGYYFEFFGGEPN